MFRLSHAANQEDERLRAVNAETRTKHFVAIEDLIKNHKFDETR